MLKKASVTFLLLIGYLFIQAQDIKLKSILLSSDEIIYIDSIRLYEPLIGLDILTINRFEPDLVSTPERAMQAFASFTTRDVAKSLVTDDYIEYFPSKNTLNLRNDSTYRSHLYLNIYFTVYFTYKGELYSSCYFEVYGNENLQNYKSMNIYKHVEDKWLLVIDRSLSKFETIGDFKPRYAKKLIVGENIESNELYSDLFLQVNSDGSLNIEKLESLLPVFVMIPRGVKNVKYIDLLNDIYKDATIIEDSN